MLQQADRFSCTSRQMPSSSSIGPLYGTKETLHGWLKPETDDMRAWFTG